MPAEDVYAFEVLIPRAVKPLFEARSITTYTIEDPVEFQRARPRAEIWFETKGPSTQRVIMPDGSHRTSAFRGELKIYIISGTETESRIGHSILQANVRDILAGLPSALNNGTTLPLHRVNFVNAGAEDTGFRQQDNYLQTTFPFTVDIAIQADAWSAL